MFTWVESPSTRRSRRRTSSRCGGEINYGNYCNKKASALLDKTATELDENTRTKLLNQAEAMMAKDVPSIPMFVRPVFTSLGEAEGSHDPDDARRRLLERQHLERVS